MKMMMTSLWALRGAQQPIMTDPLKVGILLSLLNQFNTEIFSLEIDMELNLSDSE
jgi:hypothetical protein